VSQSPRVVDFSTHFSGPTACRRLAQLGADVVKVEHPMHGDGNRNFPPTYRGQGIHHLYLNAGVRSVALDPNAENWARAVEALVRWADVVIVGKQPAAARRMGIDFATVISKKPDLVYCLISGYGLEGEWAEMPAHGLNMDALAGTLQLEWREGVPEIPERYRSVGTTVAGIEAALGIVAALHRRDRGDGGQFVHVSIWEAALATLWRDTATFANTQEPWPSYRDFGSRYAVYGTADSKALLVCPIERKFWERFCEALGLSDAIKQRGDWSSGVDMGPTYEGERALLAERLSQRTQKDWLAVFKAVGVPVAPVLDWREAAFGEHAEANGTMASYDLDGHEVRVPTTPVSVTSASDLAGTTQRDLAKAHREKAMLVHRPPQLGEHNESLLRELGIP
jgi:crotonobetainyl-CoA:carnitine CoA-transferase CaiB-like acyl-CoA transferase